MTDPARHTILVVDDEPTNLEVLASTLGAHHEVLVARSGERALRLVEETPVDLILLDILMPDVDGYEVLRRIRERPGLADTPVIFITARSGADEERRGLELGAVDYIGKPIEPSVVLARVHTQLALAAKSRMLERVAQTNRALAAIVESCGDAIMGTDLDGALVHWNAKAEEIYGYAASEIVGRPLTVLVPSDGMVRAEELHRQAREGAQHASVDVVHLRKDGARIDVSLTLSPVLDDEDRVVGVSAIARDTTDRRKLEAQLVHARKLESLGQLAAGIAHEINTPTQFVNDNTTYLQKSFRKLRPVLEKCGALLGAREAGEDLEVPLRELLDAARPIKLRQLSEELPAALEDSREGLARIADIVRAMKAFSHPGTGKKEHQDLNEAVRCTSTVARNEWKYLAELELDLEEGLPTVPLYGNEINQVILNLIVNAAHAIGETVDRDAGEKGRIRVSTRSDERSVELRIEDSGCGIPGEVVGRIFDPFFTTKEVGRGTGQGLAIAHNVVAEKHGGTISVESEVGRGSTFAIRLPRESEAESPQAA